MSGARTRSDQGATTTASRKRQDVLSRARSKLCTLSESLRHQDRQTHSPIEYFFKTHHGIYDNRYSGRTLEKQHSLQHDHVRIEITGDVGEEQEERQERRETAALALERPRKKLSFREPEIVADDGEREALRRSTSFCNGTLQHRGREFEEQDEEVVMGRE